MNISKPWMKVIFIIVLLLIILPLALFVLVQFAPPQEAPAQDEAGIADSTETRRATVRNHQARRENRVAKEETVVIEPEPVWEIGAISTDPTRKTKQMTPYAPGTVPGDSGIVPQVAEPPDDMVIGPQPLPPDDDPWGGAVLPPMTPEQMRGIGGVRRIDPNDPFFQQDIPNPFAN